MVSRSLGCFKPMPGAPKWPSRTSALYNGSAASCKRWTCCCDRCSCADLEASSSRRWRRYWTSSSFTASNVCMVLPLSSSISKVRQKEALNRMARSIASKYTRDKRLTKYFMVWRFELPLSSKFRYCFALILQNCSKNNNSCVTLFFMLSQWHDLTKTLPIWSEPGEWHTIVWRVQHSKVPSAW